MQYSKTKLVTASPTISTSAYSAGDVVGGLQRLARATEDFRRGVLKTVVVLDDDNEKAALTLLFFDSAPASIAADNAALTLTTADLARVCGKVNVAAADYETVGGQAVAVVDVAAVVQGYYGDPAERGQHRNVGDLWMVAVATGTPTYAAASDLTFRLGLLLD